MRNLIFFGLIPILLACKAEEKSTREEIQPIPLQLSYSEAKRLVTLPLECIDTEYPNKLNQVIGGTEDLRAPEALHPAFYGCFDWHSAVHGHWSLVRIVKAHPEISFADSIINGLFHHISEENIRGELDYFGHKYSYGFERMYGWAWLLKLAEEIHTWDHPTARIMEKNIAPLSALIAERVKEFLPKLHYPIRVGTHTNTAFAMTMIYDYADAVGDSELKEVVVQRAKDYFMDDKDCPLTWEPSGHDFLSPCLEEADIMRRVLPKKEFKVWLTNFLPNLSNEMFSMEPGVVSDRRDGHLVHLDGLNYSRAWCLFGIAETLPEYGHLITIANTHIEHSLPSLTDGYYEGGHWLASFALLALSE
ncbi:MAG: DUF2891 domain-containing protein [Crocinitomicaceae bacterium]|nr:DUF2891 domain-containing protein [Crocinitomicaceae bacterium]